MTTRWEVERAVQASELPAPARLLMLVLATRTTAGTTVIPAEFSPSHNTLAELTNLSRNAVIKHLKALEADGWLAVRRAPAAQQRAEKTPNRYTLRIPTSARDALANPPTSARGGLELVHQVDQKPPPASAPGGHNQNETYRPHQISSNGTLDRALTDLRATPDERTALAERIRAANPQIRNVGAYLTRLAQTGDLGDHLTAIRDEQRKATIAAELARARQGPECRHGTRGGQHIRSDTNKPLCPLCTRERRTA